MSRLLWRMVKSLRPAANPRLRPMPPRVGATARTTRQPARFGRPLIRRSGEDGNSDGPAADKPLAGVWWAQ